MSADPPAADGREHPIGTEAAYFSDADVRRILEASNDVIMVQSPDRVITYVSPSVRTAFGWEISDMVGKSPVDFWHPGDIAESTSMRRDVLSGRRGVMRGRALCADGTYRWVEVRAQPLIDITDTVVGGVSITHDVDDLVRLRDALDKQTHFDALTGLANRALAVDRIQQIMDERFSPGWALLCLGVNGLTAVNQAFTYAAGDKVLQTVAHRLVGAVGSHDRVARIAGDEFAVLLREVTTAEDAVASAERLLTAVRGPIDLTSLGGHVVHVSASAGITMTTGGDAEGALRDASTAMGQAEAKGPDGWELLDEDEAARTRRSLVMRGALRDALDRGEIRPWFMPIVALPGGEVLGYEALARWIHPDGRVSGPDKFMDVAERTGLILEVDRAVLRAALDALKVLPDQVHMAVNVSAATLMAGTLGADLVTELARTGVDPCQVHLEVTETALFRSTEAIRSQMVAIAELGAMWWVDDFGTGFSSISHLRDLPIHGLKLDMSFTAGLTERDDLAHRLASGLAGLAQGLGLATVAEGVETLEQQSVLTGQGWQMGQGWLYGKPGPLPQE